MAILILIAGGSASGKTTIAHQLIQKIEGLNVTLVAQDSYYKDVHHLTEEALRTYNFDHPDSIDSALMLEQAQAILGGKETRLPVYDFLTHRRHWAEKPVSRCDILIIEGIFALVFPELVRLADLKIFMDTDADLRILRRIDRDTRERGFDIPTVTQQYLTNVKPMYEAFIEPSKKNADIIIPGDRLFNVSLKMIEGYVISELIEKISALPAGDRHPGP